MSVFRTTSHNASIFLSYDLLEYIIRCMRNDSVCLKNASLVCHSWCSASRTWLFRRLTLNPVKYAALLALVDESESYSFVTYCKALDLRSIDVRTISPSIAVLFSAITGLSFQNISFQSLKDLLEFSSRFLHLRSIKLNNVSWIRTPPTPLPSLPAVDCLNIGGTVDYLHFFDEVGRFEVFPNLLNLNLGPSAVEHVPTFGKYLAGLSAPRVQTLSLSLIFKDHDTTYLLPPVKIHIADTVLSVSKSRSLLHEKYRQTFGLDHCLIPLPYLRHLKVQNFVNVQNSSQSTGPFWIPKCLVSIEMPNVRCIELTLVIDRAGQLDQFDIRWGFIDFTLSSTEFTNLKKVVFIVRGSADLVGIGDILCRRLPLSTERGLMYLRSGEGGDDERARVA